ncbi:hypothetical protein PLESTB_001828800 [Pleodorina starrii]|uniref:DUF2382 domain-containing protein n=1 Tax=Pleodorina starrii TaxID=330485 RepID=A0A9W6C1Y1_9CHLO|nr:hypothetical protein PLESTB_001828800 [Pleodorina starrii]
MTSDHDHDQDQAEQTVPLMEEQLTVTKRKRVTDRVRVSTITETVDSLVPVDFSDVEIDVVRVPIERDIDVVPDIVTEGDLTIIPVVEERIVITRQLVLREEIHVRRTERRETSDIPVTIRRQRAVIDHHGPQTEDRYTYAEGLSRGGVLVTVTGLTAAHYDQVLDILDDEGTVDLAEREESWRSEGWGGYEVSPHATEARTVGSSVSDDGSYADTSAQADDESIPIVEERLRVGKRDTSHGRVRVRAYTVEEPVSETVNLREDRVELERRPVDRAVTDADTAFRDRTVEAEEYVEEAVVSKEARVVEEVSLRKTSDTRQETVTDSVRHTEVEIDDERSDPSRPIR